TQVGEPGGNGGTETFFGHGLADRQEPHLSGVTARILRGRGDTGVNGGQITGEVLDRVGGCGCAHHKIPLPSSHAAQKRSRSSSITVTTLARALPDRPRTGAGRLEVETRGRSADNCPRTETVENPWRFPHGRMFP